MDMCHKLTKKEVLLSKQQNYNIWQHEGEQKRLFYTY